MNIFVIEFLAYCKSILMQYESHVFAWNYTLKKL